jgi:hypothetical protein
MKKKYIFFFFFQVETQAYFSKDQFFSFLKKNEKEKLE